MKYLLFICLALISCSDNEVNKFTNITGKWSFTIDSNTFGEFEIVKRSMTYDIKSPSFTVSGQSFALDYGNADQVGETVTNIRLVHTGAETATIILQDIVTSSDFARMTANSSWSLNAQGGNKSDLQITRK